MTEPLPCPFCGGRPLRDSVLRDGYENQRGDPDAWAFTLRCRSCAAEGGWAKSEAGALRNWNMRTSIDTASALLLRQEIAAYSLSCCGLGLVERMKRVLAETEPAA